MKRQAHFLLVALFVLVWGSTAAHASAVSVSINDLTTKVACTAVGFDPNSMVMGQLLDGLDLHASYLSNSAPPVGVSRVVNFNLFDPASEGGGLSDTLNIVFTGETPIPGDMNNVSVDLHFRSGSYAVTLPSAVDISETGTWQNLSGYVASGGGPQDFTISVASAVVPEPRSLLYWGAGLLLMTTAIRRQLRRGSGPYPQNKK